MFSTIAIAAAVLLLGFLGYIATKPNSFRIERTTSMKAPADKIFPLLNDFRNWIAWSPYEKKDPDMKRTYTGASVGKGSIYSWSGDKKIGSGNMEMTESTPHSKIVIAMHFITPFEARHTCEFTLATVGDTTTVSWVMSGAHPYFGKLMGTIFNMDKMVGTDFAAGLAELKVIAEK